MLTKALIVARQVLPGALRALVVSLAILPASAHGVAPDALIRRITAEVLASVRSEIAMGPNWRRATPAQQERLVREFRTLLVRTYSGALGG